jgi:hypothetical protein
MVRFNSLAAGVVHALRRRRPAVAPRRTRRSRARARGVARPASWPWAVPTARPEACPLGHLWGAPLRHSAGGPVQRWAHASVQRWHWDYLPTWPQSGSRAIRERLADCPPVNAPACAPGGPVRSASVRAGVKDVGSWSRVVTVERSRVRPHAREVSSRSPGTAPWRRSSWWWAPPRHPQRHSRAPPHPRHPRPRPGPAPAAGPAPRGLLLI